MVAPTTPPTSTAAPTLIPDRSDIQTFDDRVDAFVTWEALYQTEVGPIATNVFDNATIAFDSATTAAADAITATNAPHSPGTSTDSRAIGLGNLSLTIQTGKDIVGGMYAVVADTAAPSTNSMFGQVTSYTTGTGAIVLNITDIKGSGTKSAWIISFNGFNASTDRSLNNRIRNGDQRIDQRNNGSSVTIGTNTFITDGFSSQNSTGTGTIDGQQLTLSGAKSLKLIATAAVTDLTGTKHVFGVRQKIEAPNVFDLNAKNITISFMVETNWAGNLPISIRNSDDTRSYIVDVAVVSGVNAASIALELEAATVITQDVGDIGLTLAIGFNNEATLQTATTGSWVAGNFMVSTSSTQWAKTITNFINITDLQLIEGVFNAPYQRKNISEEFSSCRRYYEVGDYSCVGYNVTANNIGGAVKFEVRKMASPTLTQTSVTAINTSATTARAVLGDGTESFQSHRAVTATNPAQYSESWTAEAEL